MPFADSKFPKHRPWLDVTSQILRASLAWTEEGSDQANADDSNSWNSAGQRLGLLSEFRLNYKYLTVNVLDYS